MNKFEMIRKAIQKDPGGRGLARNPGRNLFTEFPDDLEKACRSIAEHPDPHVMIVTGFIVATTDPPRGETDGPLGAAFLANALYHRMDISTEIATDPFAFEAILAGIGQNSLEGPIPVHPVDGYSKDPTHIVAIERVGPNHQSGRCLSMRGRDITDLMGDAEWLFTARRHGIATIGIGDGGNEIGMGKMPREIIADNILNGDAIACRTPCDHLIVAGVSNWGAYALAAGIAQLKGIWDAAEWFNAFEEEKTLQRMVTKGELVDGVTGVPTATVDGLTWKQYIEPFEEIWDILTRP